ncbi:AzlC family ABC transporter permease [Slackia exigua]|uniref:AzlC family ABC transporter permease n=1 Tax=Slackia exigua TaxID=84109 RepID=UPI0023F01BE0|nr:AzlC family ABC transporter permease [Slackia exigua]
MTLDSWKDPFKAAWPIMAGYVVLGLPCGILGVAAGMDVWMVAAMSILFYSGAGQYMIPNMWLAGNPIGAIVLSVSLVNSRQTLYGALLSQFCDAASKRLACLFGATVTDESFGVNLARFMNGGWSVSDALRVNVLSQSSWILSNVAGAVVGAAISVPTALASFAMTSLFICLLSMQKASPENFVAIGGAVAGVVLCKSVGLTGPAILVGALIGVAAAVVFSRRTTHGPSGASGATDIRMGG